MPLPRQAAAPSGDMRSLYNLFKINPGSFPGVNPGAFADVANNDIADETAQYKAESPEMQREQEILHNADQRAEVGIRGDLNEAAKVRQARNLGFEGSYPLKQQQDEEERSALAKVLLPKQMELRAEMENRAATRDFNANQASQDRATRVQIAQGSQTGQNQRLQQRSEDVAARGVKLGKNPLRSFLSPIGIMDSNEQVQKDEQNRVRGNMRAQITSPSGSDGTTIMEDPNTGEQVYVPNDRVAEYEAKGARRVQ